MHFALAMTRKNCAPLHLIPKALEKTGFLLEHAVAEKFRQSGWSVIGNRYYADDVDGKARELDLVAYRVTKSRELDVFTGVLISCKKDSNHTWAFLSKDPPPNDPNVDSDPVHYWTDYEPLATYLDSCEWRREYTQTDASLYSEIFRSERSVFASQLISSDGTSPKNDTPIFDSITGLLKALDHELGALNARAKGKKRLYLFTLLTVVDAPLVDVQYSGTQGTATEIEKLTHLARYMVRKRDVTAFVHFVRADKITDFVQTLSRLATHNASHADLLIDEAYAAIRTSNKVRAYFSNKLQLMLAWRLSHILQQHGSKQQVTSIQLSYEGQLLSIDVDVYDDALEILNNDSEATNLMKTALQRHARFEGNFEFAADIPF